MVIYGNIYIVYIQYQYTLYTFTAVKYTSLLCTRDVNDAELFDAEPRLLVIDNEPGI